MKAFLMTMLLFSLFLTNAHGEEYTLHDLYRLALEQSETLKIAEEDLFITEREKDKAVADLLPSLSAFGYHTKYSEEKRQGGFLLQPDHTNEWGLRLDQTYSLSGSEFRQLKIARQEVMQGKYDLHATREGYLLDVAVNYYLVLRAKREIEIAGANVQRLTRERDAAKKRLEVGEAIRTTVLRAEAELADAESESIRAGNAFRIARNLLARTVGITGSFDVREPYHEKEGGAHLSMRVDDHFRVAGCAEPVLQCLISRALSERAEINALIIERDVAADQIRIAQGSYWPDLTLEGVYFRQENEPSASFGLKERIYGAAKLDFPLFEGGLTRAEVSEARARFRQAELRLADLRRSVSTEVENTYTTAATEAAVLKKTEAEVAFARDNYHLVSKQFQYGLADSIDVIDANTRLVTSERELVNARYVYELALLRLKRVTGILLTEIMSAKTGMPSGQETQENTGEK